MGLAAALIQGVTLGDILVFHRSSMVPLEFQWQILMAKDRASLSLWLISLQLR